MKNIRLTKKEFTDTYVDFFILREAINDCIDLHSGLTSMFCIQVKCETFNNDNDAQFYVEFLEDGDQQALCDVWYDSNSNEYDIVLYGGTIRNPQIRQFTAWMAANFHLVKEYVQKEVA